MVICYYLNICFGIYYKYEQLFKTWESFNDKAKTATSLFSNIWMLLKLFLIIFSCIKSRGSWNSNPNRLQIRLTLRKLLFRNAVQESLQGDCILNDDDFEVHPILEFWSNVRVIVDSIENNEYIVDTISLIDNLSLSHFQDCILFYIGEC